MIYFDSTYVAKFYLHEPDSTAVRSRAVLEGEVCSSVLARAEVAGVFHRKLREKLASLAEFNLLLNQFEKDCASGVWTLLPVTLGIVETVAAKYQSLPADVFLRSADAVHLATALESGHSKIFTNDRGILAAAPHFGLIGEVIS